MGFLQAVGGIGPKRKRVGIGDVLERKAWGDNQGRPIAAGAGGPPNPKAVIPLKRGGRGGDFVAVGLFDRTWGGFECQAGIVVPGVVAVAEEKNFLPIQRQYRCGESQK